MHGSVPHSLAGLRAVVAGPVPVFVMAACLFAASEKAFAQDDEQLQAYVLLVLADEARDEGVWQHAHATYERALEFYRGLAVEFPDWQPEIVRYRIAYCEDQMEALRSRLPKPKAPASSLPPDQGEQGFDRETVQILTEKLHALAGENEYLRRRIQRLEDELDRAPSPATPTDETGGPAALRQALEEAEARAERLEEEYARYRAEAGTAASSQQVTLTSLRLEKEEADLVHRDLIRQLEAAATEHSRLSAILIEEGGAVSPYALPASPDQAAPAADDPAEAAEDEEDTGDDLMDAVPP